MSRPMRSIRAWLWLLMVGLLAPPAGAVDDPVTWSARLEPADARAGEGAQVVVTAKMKEAWHIYSLTPPSDGVPVPTSVALGPGKALAAAGKAVQRPPVKKHDPGFDK